jgi:MHS family shikimate/dehydroshikimate transporter-like MFS transporter
VPETPLFESLRQRGEIAKSPFLEATVKNSRSFLVAVGLKLSEVPWVYILTVFCMVYGTSKLGLSKQLLLNAVFVAALVELLTIPLFWFLETKDPQIILFAVIVVVSFGHGTMLGLQSTFFPELFGTRARYTAASLGFRISAAIGGGLAPILATALAGYMGGTAGVSLLLIVLVAVTFVATLSARETKNVSLA